MESGICGSVSEFEIAETGAVHIEVSGGTLCFPPRRSGSRSESKAEDSVLQADRRKAVKRSVVAVVKF